VCYLFFIMGLYGVSFWLPTLIKGSGVTDPLAIGLLTTLPYAAATVSMILVGRSSDARRERRWHVALPGLIGTAGWVAAVAGSGPAGLERSAIWRAHAAPDKRISQCYSRKWRRF
jgi:MFS family permease